MIASELTRGVANIVSPIAGSAVAHRRLETERRRDARKSNTQGKKTSALHLVHDYVKNKGLQPVAMSTTSSYSSKATATPRKKSTRKRKLPSSVPDPPPPNNGKDQAFHSLALWFHSQNLQVRFFSLLIPSE